MSAKIYLTSSIVKRTDYPVLVTDAAGEKKIYIVELQSGEVRPVISISCLPN